MSAASAAVRAHGRRIYASPAAAVPGAGAESRYALRRKRAALPRPAVRCGGTASRRLGAEEVNVAVLVYPDAHLEIRTTADALGELSTAGEMLGLLEELS
jgi:hypothetical protein